VTAPLLPDYGGASLDSVVPAILGRRDHAPAWLPAPVATAEQVARMALFLASDDSDHSTGSEFVVDGGTVTGQVPPAGPV